MVRQWRLPFARRNLFKYELIDFCQQYVVINGSDACEIGKNVN